MSPSHEVDDTVESALAQRALNSARATPQIGRPMVDSPEVLPPQGSARRYVRVGFEGGITRMAMLLPALDAAPAEAGGARVERVQDEPFLRVAEWLREGGARVPRVFGVDAERRVIWIEDLGDTDLDQGVASVAGDPAVATMLYRDAIDLLVDVHRAMNGTKTAAPVAIPEFSREHWAWELEHYVEWRLQGRLGVELSSGQRSKLNRAFSWLCDELCNAPSIISHRDFQSHNIMLTTAGEIVCIDFQDAIRAPAVYDAVALLRDSYVVLGERQLEELVDYWTERAAGIAFPSDMSTDEISRLFHIQTVQRKLKDTGRFEFFDLKQNKSSFLRYIPDSVRYVAQAAAKFEELNGLCEVLIEVEPHFSGEPDPTKGA